MNSPRTQARTGWNAGSGFVARMLWICVPPVDALPGVPEIHLAVLVSRPPRPFDIRIYLPVSGREDKDSCFGQMMSRSAQRFRLANAKVEDKAEGG